MALLFFRVLVALLPLAASDSSSRRLPLEQPSLTASIGKNVSSSVLKELRADEAPSRRKASFSPDGSVFDVRLSSELQEEERMSEALAPEHDAIRSKAMEADRHALQQTLRRKMAELARDATTVRARHLEGELHAGHEGGATPDH